MQDLDFDGCDEVFLHTAHLQAVVRNDADAALCELSSYDLSHNFADTLTRRREHYYRNLARRDEHASQHGGIASAHDRVAFRHEIRPEDTVSDDRLRSCFLDSVVDEGEELHPCYARVPGTDAEFAAGLSHGHVTKTYALEGNRLRAAYVIELTHASEFRVQLNLAMPSCDGFLGRISRNGVDFNALDKQPVYSVFLLVSPEDRPEEHLQAMELIFKNLSKETFRRMLRQAASADDVRQLLTDADNMALPA